MMQTLAIPQSDLRGLMAMVFVGGMFAGIAVRAVVAWIWHLLKKPQT